jgi:hypothetical protein
MRIGDLNTVGLAVQTQEGYYPGTLAYTNNNPGNLVAAGQPGCSPGAGGFCAFPSYDLGYQALLNQISLDASRGYTILQFTTKYLGGDVNNPGVAPGGDPNVYAANIAAAAGVSPNDLLSTAIASDGFTVDALANTLEASAMDPMTMGLMAVGGALLLAWALA